MDDDFDKLEAELRRIRPAATSRALDQRIDGALAPRRLTRPFRRWVWLALPAAAAIALAIATMSPRRVADNSTAARPTPAAFKPVAAENVLVSSQDEGLVTLSDGTPARRVRQTYVDTITWKNSRTNASLTWSLPREELRTVPLILQ